jgi:diacylglycerol kinase family enzyme
MLTLREKTYHRFGRSQLLAYLSTIRALAQARDRLRVSIETEHGRNQFATPLLFAVNNSYQLEEFEIRGSECVKDGRIAMYVPPPVGRFGLIRLGWKMIRRRLDPHSDFRLVCAKSFRVETRRFKLRVAYDGELTRMRAPLDFVVHENALRVLVPRHHKAA